MQLSPLNFSGLISAHQPHPAPAPKPKGTAIMCWKCSECDEVHDDIGSAESCCPPDQDFSEPNYDCPICSKECQNHRDATDCCLWKDIDAAARYSMADKVEAGATWAEVLKIHHHRIT